MGIETWIFFRGDGLSEEGLIPDSNFDHLKQYIVITLVNKQNQQKKSNNFNKYSKAIVKILDFRTYWD